MTSWTIADIPPQSGKLAVITGSTGGLGFETALALAQTGAEVVLTGRNDAKGHAAIAKIHSRFPGAKISYENLDLASLASVAAFAQRFDVVAAGKIARQQITGAAGQDLCALLPTDIDKGKGVGVLLARG